MVTRRDLIPGYQSVQPAHALAKFQHQFPRVYKNWYLNIENIAILAVKDEQELKALISKADELKIKHVYFKEPDIGNETTAMALEPCEATYKITSCIPLALKEFVT